MLRLLIILITTLFFYRRTIHYGYIIDDIEVATHEKTGIWWKDFWYQIRGHGYFNRVTEHTITLLIHTINCMLIYKAFGSNDVSFLAAMLFAVNPVNNQASVWLSGKVYALAATFILLGWWIKPLFPLFYFTSFYFSLNGVLTPLLFLFTPQIYFAVLPIILGFFFKNKVIGEPKRRYKQGSIYMRELSPRKLIISIKTLGYYFRLCLFPFKLGMCHKYLHEYGLTKQETEKWYSFDKYFWLGLGVILTAGIGLLNRWEVFGLIWFIVLTAQWCNFLVLNHPVCERYVYLSNIGLMIMLAKALMTIPYGMYLAVAIWTFYVTKLWFFLPSYKTNYAYFRSNKQEFEDVAIAYNQEGLEAIRFGQPSTALDIFMQGLFYRPYDFRLNYNSANLMIGMGKFEQAKFFLHRAHQSLDKGLDNYDVWMGGINQMKDHIRKQGINVN